MNVVKPSVELWSITPNATKLIERAGRICYKSEDRIGEGSDVRFIKDVILTKNHLSVIEHAVATYWVRTDRGVSHEAVRHRIASYSQESTRYCNYTKGKFGGEISIMLPPEIEAHPEGLKIYTTVMDVINKGYKDLIALGFTPQIARGVLPIDLKTEFVWTTNFREWLHIIDLRTSNAAHPRMREIAGQIADSLAVECPIIFANRSHLYVDMEEAFMNDDNTPCGCTTGLLKADYIVCPHGNKMGWPTREDDNG